MGLVPKKGGSRCNDGANPEPSSKTKTDTLISHVTGAGNLFAKVIKHVSTPSSVVGRVVSLGGLLEKRTRPWSSHEKK